MQGADRTSVSCVDGLAFTMHWQVLSIGLGVGLSAVLGMLKFMYNLPLKALIAGSLLPTIAAACWMQW